MLRSAYSNSEAISCSQSPVHLSTFTHTSRTSSAATAYQPRGSASKKSLSSAAKKKTTVTMRRSNAASEIPLPITYTPTTHRISKAKKGKRVHACEFPGCNKVGPGHHLCQGHLLTWLRCLQERNIEGSIASQLYHGRLTYHLIDGMN